MEQFYDYRLATHTIDTLNTVVGIQRPATSNCQRHGTLRMRQQHLRNATIASALRQA